MNWRRRSKTGVVVSRRPARESGKVRLAARIIQDPIYYSYHFSLFNTLSLSLLTPPRTVLAKV